MAPKKCSQHLNEARAVIVLETEMEELWREVSVEEKMTNQKLEKKLGFLRQILQGLKSCTDNMQLGNGYEYSALDPSGYRR
jgi:hypothetical protein